MYKLYFPKGTFAAVIKAATPKQALTAYITQTLKFPYTYNGRVYEKSTAKLLASKVLEDKNYEATKSWDKSQVLKELLNILLYQNHIQAIPKSVKLDSNSIEAMVDNEKVSVTVTKFPLVFSTAEVEDLAKTAVLK